MKTLISRKITGGIYVAIMKLICLFATFVRIVNHSTLHNPNVAPFLFYRKRSCSL